MLQLFVRFIYLFFLLIIYFLFTNLDKFEGGFFKLQNIAEKHFVDV